MIATLPTIAATLREAQTVTLIAHVNPDADSLGSALAIAMAVEAAGVKARVTFPDQPFRIPEGLAYLPRQDLLWPPDEVTDSDVVLAVDASSADRLAGALEVGRAASTFIAIDHHASFDHFADLNFVDPRQPATGMIAMALIREMGVALTRDMATCLYAAISSDTGSFRYPATTPDSLRAAAALMELGIDFSDVAKAMFDTKSLPFLKLQAEVMSNLEVQTFDGKTIAVAEVTAEQRSRHGVDFTETEALIDQVRTVEGIDVAVALKEDDRGHWRASVRSLGSVDVGRACTSLGGGGHRMAAGFTGSASATETLDDLLAALASQ